MTRSSYEKVSSGAEHPCYDLPASHIGLTPMKSLPVLLVLASLCLYAAPASAAAPTKKSAGTTKTQTANFDRDQGEEWNRGPAKDVAGLPRVLLLCDFVTIGYGDLVRQKLAGKANVHSTMQAGRQTLTDWASSESWFQWGKFDVIHFGCGLHILDLPEKGKVQLQPNITLADYEKDVRACVAALKKTGAKLIFATMTAVPAEEDVATYNQVALKVMKENGIAIDDLHAEAGPQVAKLQNAHNIVGFEFYTDEGYVVLSKAVMKSLTLVMAK